MRGGGARVFLHSHCLLQYLGCLWHRGQRCLATRALLLEREGCQRSISIYNSLCLVCLLSRSYQFLKLGLTYKTSPSGPKGTWQAVLVDKKIVYGLAGSRDGDSALSQGSLNSPGSKVASLSFMVLPQAFLEHSWGHCSQPRGRNSQVTDVPHQRQQHYRLPPASLPVL